MVDLNATTSCKIYLDSASNYLHLQIYLNEQAIHCITWWLHASDIYLGRFIKKSAKTNKKKQGRQEYKHKMIMR